MPRLCGHIQLPNVREVLWSKAEMGLLTRAGFLQPTGGDLHPSVRKVFDG